MRGGKLLACEPHGPRGIIGSQGAVVLLKHGGPGGQQSRCPVFLGADVDEFGNLPIPPFAA